MHDSARSDYEAMPFIRRQIVQHVINIAVCHIVQYSVSHIVQHFIYCSILYNLVRQIMHYVRQSCSVPYAATQRVLTVREIGGMPAVLYPLTMIAADLSSRWPGDG